MFPSPRTGNRGRPKEALASGTKFKVVPKISVIKIYHILMHYFYKIRINTKKKKSTMYKIPKCKPT